MPGSAAEIPEPLGVATEHQPAARAALTAALAAGPAHAYLLAGPPGSGKRTAARAFAAELLAAGASEPAEARRRALLDPSPHPDLAWLIPPGTQHLVADVRERVIAAAAYRPFEGARRVFVVEAAEAMADESQNALLRTLEEPPPFAHLLLLSSQPAALLPTVRSRCQTVRFAPLGPEAIAARLASDGAPGAAEEQRAAARLAGGDAGRARFLLAGVGHELRDGAIECARAARGRRSSDAPWRRLLESAEEAGAEAAREVDAAARERAAEAADEREADRIARAGAEDGKRAARARRTEALDLGLALCGAWLRDLVAIAEGAPELALHADRLAELRDDASGLPPGRARRAGELVAECRSRLRVNVSEELALEALIYRVEALIGGEVGEKEANR